MAALRHDRITNRALSPLQRNQRSRVGDSVSATLHASQCATPLSGPPVASGITSSVSATPRQAARPGITLSRLLESSERIERALIELKAATETGNS